MMHQTPVIIIIIISCALSHNCVIVAHPARVNDVIADNSAVSDADVTAGDVTHSVQLWEMLLKSYLCKKHLASQDKFDDSDVKSQVSFNYNITTSYT